MDKEELVGNVWMLQGQSVGEVKVMTTLAVGPRSVSLEETSLIVVHSFPVKFSRKRYSVE